MSNKLLSILVGGLTFGILTILAKIVGNAGAGTMGGLLSSAAYVAGAWVAVWTHTYLTAARPTLWQGAGVGALLGGVCALLVPVVSLVLVKAGFIPDPVAVLEAQLAAMPEEQRALTKQIFAFSQSPLGIALNAMVGTVLGALGGMAKAWMFNRKKRSSQPNSVSTPNVA